jgi:serine phosphatase RsbU (regulator of sigma subunit)
MVEFDIRTPSFQQAELRSERTRVRVVLGVFGGLFALILMRGIASLVVEGRRGEAWPFVAVLLVMTAYEVVWLRVVVRAINLGRSLSKAMWKSSIFVESLLPTVALFLQIHSTAIGPNRALTSPVVLAYFLLIILSTLHLDPGLSRLSGAYSAAGYGVAAVYVFVFFPEAPGAEKLLPYAAAFSCIALLILGGFAAGAVAAQIREHAITALTEAESRGKLENALALARNIQEGLLPKTPPNIEGFDIAGWNHPADETGGDYFDWQRLPDGQLAITIADVTGHGIGPALLMSGCRAYARAGFAEGPSLRDFLNNLNQLLCEDLPPEKFVTMAVGVLDPEEATAELISAGHGPLLFYRREEDRFRSYDPQGVPLGLMPHVRYPSPHTLRFAPGDILLFVTDGFVEWPNATDEDFGQNRIKSVIRANQSKPAATIVSELYAAIANFADSRPQPDDLTVVVVKRV